MLGEDRQEPDSPSWYNPEEVKYVCATLDTLYKRGIGPQDIGKSSGLTTHSKGRVTVMIGFSTIWAGG